MFSKLKTFLGINEDFNNLAKDLRESNGENWLQKLRDFRKSNNQPVSDKRVTQLGLDVYEAILQKVIADLKITKEEKEELQNIVDLFYLDENDILKIEQKYSRDAVRKLTLNKLNDTILTEEEREEIELFASEFDISAAEVNKIQKEVSLNVYEIAVKQAISDGILTNEEASNLSHLASNLQIDIANAGLDEKTQQTLDFLALLNALDNGYLPTVQNSSIVLQKNETAHWQIAAELLTSKVVTTGYTGASSGVSIRVIKGVSYRVGSTRSHAIKEQITIRHPGVLVITNKRIVFASTQKSFSIPFTQLISFVPYSDGLGLQKANTNYTLTVPTEQGAEVTLKILASSINRSL